MPPLVMPPQVTRKPPVRPRLEVEAVQLPSSTTGLERFVPTPDRTALARRPSPIQMERVQATPSLPGGTGEAPDLVFLTPDASRALGPGGGLVGKGSGYPKGLGADPSLGVGAGDAAGATGPEGLSGEPAFAADGSASSLGRRYGVPLVEAARLGQRTSDGARYNLLVPMLSEAFSVVRTKRGLQWAARGGDLTSVRIDDDAIALRYRDGTVHVIVPTPDGLIGLYVSADDGLAHRSKVSEAERALEALRQLIEAGGSR
jgi:hypothetical protein